MDLTLRNESSRSRIPVRHDAPAQEIAFAAGKSTLGTVLVARSARGICAILIGAEMKELVADLTAQFPENTFVRNDTKLDGDVQKILRFIETPARSTSSSMFEGRRFSAGSGMLCAGFRPDAL
jgi:hypothetical protein